MTSRLGLKGQSVFLGRESTERKQLEQRPKVMNLHEECREIQVNIFQGKG